MIMSFHIKRRNEIRAGPKQRDIKQKESCQRVAERKNHESIRYI